MTLQYYEHQIKKNECCNKVDIYNVINDCLVKCPLGNAICNYIICLKICFNTYQFDATTK